MTGERERAIIVDTRRGLDPALLPTAMPNFRNVPALRARLVAKLQEYQDREALFSRATFHERLAQEGVDAYLGMFSHDILEALLDIEAEDTRDLDKHPILIDEIGSRVMDRHFQDRAELKLAMRIPFVADENSPTGYAPDWKRLAATGKSIVHAFGEAYFTVMGFAANCATETDLPHIAI